MLRSTLQKKSEQFCQISKWLLDNSRLEGSCFLLSRSIAQFSVRSLFKSLSQQFTFRGFAFESLFLESKDHIAFRKNTQEWVMQRYKAKEALTVDVLAINAICTPCSYRQTDVGTGRCRLSHRLFRHLDISSGWILRLTGPNVSVLCSTWPDTENILSDDNEYCSALHICIDDTVHRCAEKLQSWSTKQWKVRLWMPTECIYYMSLVFSVDCCCVSARILLICSTEVYIDRQFENNRVQHEYWIHGNDASCWWIQYISWQTSGHATIFFSDNFIDRPSLCSVSSFRSRVVCGHDTRESARWNSSVHSRLFCNNRDVSGSRNLASSDSAFCHWAQSKITSDMLMCTVR